MKNLFKIETKNLRKTLTNIEINTFEDDITGYTSNQKDFNYEVIKEKDRTMIITYDLISDNMYYEVFDIHRNIIEFGNPSIYSNYSQEFDNLNRIIEYCDKISNGFKKSFEYIGHSDIILKEVINDEVVCQLELLHENEIETVYKQVIPKTDMRYVTFVKDTPLIITKYINNDNSESFEYKTYTDFTYRNILKYLIDSRLIRLQEFDNQDRLIKSTSNFDNLEIEYLDNGNYIKTYSSITINPNNEYNEIVTEHNPDGIIKVKKEYDLYYKE